MNRVPPVDDCRSFFASGELTSDAYTNAWIRLINTLEKQQDTGIQQAQKSCTGGPENE